MSFFEGKSAHSKMISLRKLFFHVELLGQASIHIVKILSWRWHQHLCKCFPRAPYGRCCSKICIHIVMVCSEHCYSHSHFTDEEAESAQVPRASKCGASSWALAHNHQLCCFPSIQSSRRWGGHFPVPSPARGVICLLNGCDCIINTGKSIHQKVIAECWWHEREKL